MDVHAALEVLNPAKNIIAESSLLRSLKSILKDIRVVQQGAWWRARCCDLIVTRRDDGVLKQLSSDFLQTDQEPLIIFTVRNKIYGIQSKSEKVSVNRLNAELFGTSIPKQTMDFRVLSEQSELLGTVNIQYFICATRENNRILNLTNIQYNFYSFRQTK